MDNWRRYDAGRHEPDPRHDQTLGGVSSKVPAVPFGRRRRAQGLAERGIPPNLKSYVCVEVFDCQRPVLYVTRPDGDWCFLCGEEHPHDASAYRVVGIGHPIGSDPTLVEILDLGVDEEAERASVGAAWSRSRG